jgi:predicted regulator of amino acid metabolism with ACT domain
MINPKQIEPLKDELMRICTNIEDQAHDMIYTARKLYNSIYEYDCKAQKENPYIIKRIIKHVADGLDAKQAIFLAADELNISTERAKILLQTQKCYLSALNLYAKKYMVEKLKKAGLSVSDIAKMTGVSKNHVYKLLKCKANLWILSCG